MPNPKIISAQFELVADQLAICSPRKYLVLSNSGTPQLSVSNILTHYTLIETNNTYFYKKCAEKNYLQKVNEKKSSKKKKFCICVRWCLAMILLYFDFFDIMPLVPL